MLLVLVFLVVILCELKSSISTGTGPVKLCFTLLVIWMAPAIPAPLYVFHLQCAIDSSLLCTTINQGETFAEPWCMHLCARYNTTQKNI